MPAGSSNSPAGVASVLALVRRRVPACWRLKALLAVTVAFTFCVPYFLVGNFPVMAVRTLPLTRIDQAIGFHPYQWVWIYQSEYLLVNAIPWLATRRDELLRYTRGFALLALSSFVVFFLFPIASPRPVVTNPTGMYWLLLSYDVPYNALPSLHAGMVVYTLAFGNRVVGHEISRPIKWFFVVWTMLILYATLATKEHYLVDIVAGTLLGLVVDRWAWRRFCPSAGGGVDEDAAEQGADVPRGGEVVVGAANGEHIAGQVEQIAQQDAAAVVGAERR
jgi:membrane-associated phospholipid phosphatase